MDYDDDWAGPIPYGVSAAERDEEAEERWFAEEKVKKAKAAVEKAIAAKEEFYCNQPKWIRSRDYGAWYKYVKDRIVRSDGVVLLDKLVDVLTIIKDGATPRDIFNICVNYPFMTKCEIIYAIQHFSMNGENFATELGNMLEAERKKQQGDDGMTM